MSAETPALLSRTQQLALVVLRFAVGWHLFLQGYGKLVQTAWSARPYIETATGPLAGVFRALAGRSTLLAVCDTAIPWALVVLGLLLMLGLVTRTASLAAIVLVASFVLARPPLLVGGILVVGGDGNAELYVNQTVIEILALAVTLTFDTGRLVGLDVLMRSRRAKSVAAVPSKMGPPA
jgi:thiosulfate dehydrogenase (quinone) large subunit